jgi:CheY-like chemotaxis protein
VRHFKCFDAVMQIVRFTSGAADALRKIEEQNFDFILIDFQMPEMDGVTLAREIVRRTQTPLILLSSSGEIISGEDAKFFRPTLKTNQAN